MARDNQISLYMRNDDDTPVSFDSFVYASQDLLKLLREIEITYSKERKARIHWQINELKNGSAYVGAIGISNKSIPYTGDVIAGILTKGLVELEESKNIPEYFSEQALEYAQELSLRIGKKARKIVIGAKDCIASITTRLSANIQDLNEAFCEIGTVEGFFKTVSLAGKHIFNIYDRITDSAIQCELSDSILAKLSDKKLNEILDKRVLVTGTVLSNTYRIPKKIKDITDIQVFPDDNTLPTIENLLDADIDLSGGLSLSEFLEARNARSN